MKIIRSSLVILLLAPLAALYKNHFLSKVPSIGKLRGNFFQALGNRGAMTSNAWN